MYRRSYWIIGSGRFGRIACKRLMSRRSAADLLVVDRQKVSLPAGVASVVGDAVAFLDKWLTPQTDAWIIPAVPFHLAYEWFAGRLAPTRRFFPHAVPDNLLPTLPNPLRGAGGQVYLSNADFRCPDGCPEPSKICTATGKLRPRVMHAYLSRLAFESYHSVVIRSRQLAPGVGGFEAATLWALYRGLCNQNGHFLFSTACKCHAVMHAFRLTPIPHRTGHNIRRTNGGVWSMQS